MKKLKKSIDIPTPVTNIENSNNNEINDNGDDDIVEEEIEPRIRKTSKT